MTFFRYASELVTGDDVLLEEQFELIPAKVTNVSSFIMQGMFDIIHNYQSK